MLGVHLLLFAGISGVSGAVGGVGSWDQGCLEKCQAVGKEERRWEDWSAASRTR